MNEGAATFWVYDMKEKWILLRKGADYQGLSAQLKVDPLLVRIMVNRGLTTAEEMRRYLYGTKEDLHDPHLLKDADVAAGILAEKIRAGKKIRVIGDYDIDGIMATYILQTALSRCGAAVDHAIPDRIKDGYGLNCNLIEAAAEAGVDTILTCDNGIAAFEAVSLAKSLGMTVVITDHHQVPFDEVDGKRIEKKSEADAVVNPHQEEDIYPFPDLCGAAVAWKLVQLLYEQMEIPAEEADTFIEQAGFATIGDVMDLTGENRILAKLGLASLSQTKNIGMRALIAQNELTGVSMSAYHVGFRLGPCLNAGGRLDSAELSLKLLLSKDEREAVPIAIHVTQLNEQRKTMTEQAVVQAREQIEEKGYEKDPVLVIFLPDCHESLAGIVAGRIREAYYRPVLVITRGESCAKGSGRSIEAYSMYEELAKCADLFLKFGGHPMAAGFSLAEENIDRLRADLNRLSELTNEDLQPKVSIDADMPISYPDFSLIEQLQMLEPFGKANEKPLFAQRNLKVSAMRVFGKNHNVCRLDLIDASGARGNGIYFGDPAVLYGLIGEKYGPDARRQYEQGRITDPVSLHICYYPDINEYNGNRSIQYIIRHVC